MLISAIGVHDREFVLQAESFVGKHISVIFIPSKEINNILLHALCFLGKIEKSM